VQKVSKLTRRKFFGLAAGSATLAAGCQDNPVPYSLPKPEVPGTAGWLKGEQRYVPTTCDLCFAACSLQVRVVEGRAVLMRANQMAPAGEAAVSPKGLASCHLLYHPDRIRQPLKRRGQRGSGDWEQIGWDEAIEQIGSRLAELRRAGSPHKLVLVDGEPVGMTHQFWQRFLTAFGSPNHIVHRSGPFAALALALEAMQGIDSPPTYDLANARFIVAFGESLLERDPLTMQWFAQARVANGAKFVLASPSFSITASKADAWLQIKPGTYGALALALAAVLVREQLYDAEFIEQHTFGFEAWTDKQGREHRGFRELLTGDYAPEKLAEQIGLEPAEIIGLARQMAATRPAVAVADPSALCSTNGLPTAMAIHALNALLGNLERPGGALVSRTLRLKPWPDPELDEVAKAGLGQSRIDSAGSAAAPLAASALAALPDAILSGKPYDVEVLLLYRSNPVYSKPGGRRWLEAIKKVPLVISFSPLPDESALWADYVLPEHTYLERWELVEPVCCTTRKCIKLRQPAVAPRHNTKPTGDVILAMAAAIGGPVAKAFPWQEFRAAQTERLGGLEAQTGHSSTEGLLSELQAAGAWWAQDPEYEQWEQAFRTPSGKFEFYSQKLADKLAAVPAEQLEQALKQAELEVRGDLLCMPHWRPPHMAGDPAEFPFVLLPRWGIEYAEGGFRHLGLLVELPDAGHGAGWDPLVEMHPIDAAGRGLTEGQWVRVRTPAGQARLRLRVTEKAAPGTLVLHLGRGPWPPSLERLVPVDYGLIAAQQEPLTGLIAWLGTRAEVSGEPA